MVQFIVHSTYTVHRKAVIQIQLLCGIISNSGLLDQDSEYGYNKFNFLLKGSVSRGVLTFKTVTVDPNH